jgi:hypothetical protein
MLPAVHTSEHIVRLFRTSEHVLVQGVSDAFGCHLSLEEFEVCLGVWHFRARYRLSSVDTSGQFDIGDC